MLERCFIDIKGKTKFSIDCFAVSIGCILAPQAFEFNGKKHSKCLLFFDTHHEEITFCITLLFPYNIVDLFVFPWRFFLSPKPINHFLIVPSVKEGAASIFHPYYWGIT